jgi:hypothetical protein
MEIDRMLNRYFSLECTLYYVLFAWLKSEEVTQRYSSGQLVLAHKLYRVVHLKWNIKCCT